MIAMPEGIAGFERYPGYISAEAEMQLDMLPAEFAARASIQIPASISRDILGRIDIGIPGRITKADLNGGILDDVPKLTLSQTGRFVEEARNYGG